MTVTSLNLTGKIDPLVAELADASGYRLALATAGGAQNEEDLYRALETLRLLRAGIEDARKENVTQ